MAIQPQEQMIFKRVGLSDRKQLFRHIASHNINIILKTEEDVIFQLVAAQTENDEVLLCHPTDESRKSEKNLKVTANFIYEDDRYFFQTEVSHTHGWAVLRTDVDLFQLQRRANTRVDLPQDYSAAFSINSHQGKKYFLEAQLIDISAGGMKITWAEGPLVKNGDIVRGHLRLGYRRPLEFDVEVRHVIKKDEADGKFSQVAGVQFSGINNMMENRLLSLMMNLQRELYLKYLGKDSN